MGNGYALGSSSELENPYPTPRATPDREEHFWQTPQRPQRGVEPTPPLVASRSSSGASSSSSMPESPGPVPGRPVHEDDLFAGGERGLAGQGKDATGGKTPDMSKRVRPTPIETVAPASDAQSSPDSGELFSPLTSGAPLERRNSLYLPMSGESSATWPNYGSPDLSQAPRSPSAIHPIYGLDASPAVGPTATPNLLTLQRTPSPLLSHAVKRSDPPRPFYNPPTSPGRVLMTDSATRKLLDSPAAWLVLYFLANLGLTLYNKIVLVKFPFPWSLTAMHTLCGSMGARAALSQGIFTQARLNRRESLVLVAFSGLYTINIAVSNLSLHLVTVPFHQVVRAMTPLFTIALSVTFLRKHYSRNVYLSLIPIIAGVAFATYGDYYFTMWGLILTLFGTMLAAMKTVLTNVIQVGRLKLHPLDLLLRMSPLAFMQCIIAAWWTGELERVRVHGALNMSRGNMMALFTNGFLAFLLNVVSFSANKKTSPLTMTVAANVKQVLTILLAVTMFNLKVTGTNLLGIILTLGGGMLYAGIEFGEKHARARRSSGSAPLSAVSVTTMPR